MGPQWHRAREWAKLVFSDQCCDQCSDYSCDYSADREYTLYSATCSSESSVIHATVCTW